mgnify:CR=1 FL=1
MRKALLVCTLVFCSGLVNGQFSVGLVYGRIVPDLNENVNTTYGSFLQHYSALYGIGMQFEIGEKWILGSGVQLYGINATHLNGGRIYRRTSLERTSIPLEVGYKIHQSETLQLYPLLLIRNFIGYNQKVSDTYYQTKQPFGRAELGFGVKFNLFNKLDLMLQPVYNPFDQELTFQFGGYFRLSKPKPPEQ